MAGVKGRSGGARANVGKPRKPGSVRWQREQRKQRRQAGVAPVEPTAPPVTPAAMPVLDMPVCLTGGALVWLELAPEATKKGTLTPATASAFALLCQNVALERQMRAAELGAGVGGPDHRGMIRLVEMGMDRFGLNANGKAEAAPEKPVDEWAEFDQPLTLVKGSRG